MLTLHKGQIVTIDLVFALTLMIAIVFIINTQWGVMLNNIDGYETAIGAEKASHIASLYLINGPGYPADWNYTTVQLVGLAKNLNVMDSGKFTELMKISNSTLGEKLGVPDFKIFINLTNSSGTTINYTGLAPENYSTLSRLLSYVSYNGVPAKIYVTVWK